ncbi:hypothetical protein [[Mycobacterium] appelbergii]|nr:hypothetical protein [Mycobacterium sp. 21AC1]
MSIVERSTGTVWEGPPASATGRLSSGSGALTGLDVTWAELE